MRRQLPEDSKIVRGRDQPPSKMPAPETIDDHTRGQRVLRAGDPPGKLQSPTLLRGHCWLVKPRNHWQHPARNALSQSHVIPPEMHLRIRDRILCHPHHSML